MSDVQVYVITSGEYSNYVIDAIVTGPAGANIHDLWREFKVDTVYPGQFRDGWNEWIFRMKDRYDLRGNDYWEGAIFASWLEQRHGRWKIVAYKEINIED